MKKILASSIFFLTLFPVFSQSNQETKSASLVQCSNCVVGNVIISADGKFSKGAPVEISASPYNNLMVGVYKEHEVTLIDLTGTRVEKTFTVATSGIAEVMYNSENGTIHRGDPVTSSNTPGTAMKATEPGMILGIALEDAPAEQGLIKIRILIQYFK